MKLEWSAFALSDREAIFDHVVQESARHAAMLDQRIEARVEALEEFPKSGRPGRVSGTRELVITGTSYIAAYSATSDVIRILRILHTSQLWPDELMESDLPRG